MKYLPEEPYRRAVYLVFYATLGTVAIYAAIRYAIPILFPFFLSFAVASLLRRPSAALAKALHISLKASAVLLSVLVMLSVVGLLLFGAVAAVEQLGALAKGLIMGENAILEGITEAFGRLSSLVASLPFFKDGAEELGATVGAALTDMIGNVFVSLAARLPAYAAKTVSFVPQALFFSVVTILSAVYFAADYDRLVTYVKSDGKGLWRGLLRELYGQTGRTLAKYARSYLILFFFTFAELFLGFILLRLRYAFLLALLTALIDILPVLGTGTVLIPWALYHIFMGNLPAATGLLVLYAAVTVMRRLLEPRIVGAGIGMSPLLSLFSMYVGYKIFGISGIIFLPLAVAMAKNTAMAYRASRHKDGKG